MSVTLLLLLVYLVAGACIFIMKKIQRNRKLFNFYVGWIVVVCAALTYLLGYYVFDEITKAAG